MTRPSFAVIPSPTVSYNSQIRTARDPEQTLTALDTVVGAPRPAVAVIPSPAIFHHAQIRAARDHAQQSTILECAASPHQSSGSLA
jgi:hypothetical protein